MDHLCPLQYFKCCQALFSNRVIAVIVMADLEPCRSNTKRRKLGSNGSSVLDPGSSSSGNGNRKKSTSTFGSSGYLVFDNQKSVSGISFVVVDPDPAPPLIDGEQQRNQCEMSLTLSELGGAACSCLNLWPVKYEPQPKWRFNSLYTMEEIESMIEPGYFDGDRLHDPDCCNCESCKIVWEPVP